MNDVAAVVVLGFGGPESADEIRPFLDRVLAGRPIPKERYESVVGHYLDIGGKSPYNELTRKQVAALTAELRELKCDLPVEIAYRTYPPYISDVLRRYADAGAKKLLGIVLAPYRGSASAGRYIDAVERAREAIGESAPEMFYVKPWFDHPLVIRAHAQRLKAALAALGKQSFDGTRVVFTAHSVPLRDPGAEIYVHEFAEMAKLIASEARLDRVELAYQSRSGSPSDPWLEPDISDELADLAASGVREVIVSPVGFLCDHVEVLYDLDVQARQTAKALGMRMQRAPALNDHPLFVEMLAERTIEALACE
jgi:protoporphyrin/coproporphyrin ferrochelatase